MARARRCTAPSPASAWRWRMWRTGCSRSTARPRSATSWPRCPSACSSARCSAARWPRCALRGGEQGVSDRRYLHAVRRSDCGSRRWRQHGAHLPAAQGRNAIVIKRPRDARVSSSAEARPESHVTAAGGCCCPHRSAFEHRDVLRMAGGHPGLSGASLQQEMAAWVACGGVGFCLLYTLVLLPESLSRPAQLLVRARVQGIGYRAPRRRVPRPLVVVGWCGRTAGVQARCMFGRRARGRQPGPDRFHACWHAAPKPAALAGLHRQAGLRRAGSRQLPGAGRHPCPGEARRVRRLCRGAADARRAAPDDGPVGAL